METKYPDLDCLGKLTRVGSSKSYVFFVEVITKGQADKGGRCPDGTITVARHGRQARGRMVRQHPGDHRRGLRNAGEEVAPQRADDRCRKGAVQPCSCRRLIDRPDRKPPASRPSGEARRSSASSSRPQKSMFQSSSTCAAAHASSAARRPWSTASAISAEPVKVVMTCTAPSRQGSRGIAARAAASAASGCATNDHPLRRARSARRARRAPRRGPDPSAAPAAQPALRTFGAIEHQIGGEILSDFRRDRRGRIGDAVDDGVGEPRERHVRRIDDLALRLPFRGQRLGQRARGRGQRAARRRPHRTAVEQDAVTALAVRDLGLLRRSAGAVAAACRAAPLGRDRAAHWRKYLRRDRAWSTWVARCSSRCWRTSISPLRDACRRRT